MVKIGAQSVCVFLVFGVQLVPQALLIFQLARCLVGMAVLVVQFLLNLQQTAIQRLLFAGGLFCRRFVTGRLAA